MSQQVLEPQVAQNGTGEPDPDMFEADKVQHTKYGRFVFRKSYKQAFATGITIAVTLHAVIVGGYFLYQFLDKYFNKDEDIPVITAKINKITDLLPPPSLNAPPPTAAAAAAPPPNVGKVQEVKDDEAPKEQTLATQTQISQSSGKGDTTGTGAGEVAIAAPPTAEIKDEDPPDFVAVEKNPEPLVSILSLAKYPDIAKKAGIEGRVVVKVLIDKDGKPLKSQILKNPGTDIFDESATKAVMDATYSPAEQNGKPVKVWMVIPISYKLNKQ
jgi:protein TonB